MSLSSASAQVRPVTGISAHYNTIGGTNDNYSVAGGGTGNYPAGTTYQMTFNSSEQNNLIIQGFETGTNVYNYIQLAQQINIVRVDSSVTGRHNIVFFEEDSVSGTNVNLKPSLVTTMVNSLRSDLVNRGADNVFCNVGNGDGNNNNIERIDYVFNAGFPYYNFTDQRGFLVMDRGGNDRFKIAVITAVDTNGMPTVFSRPVTVMDTEWGPSGITLETTVMRGYTENGQPLKPSARTTTQPLSGVFLSWDQFGLTTNDMVYGYSLAANDVSTNGAHWTQVTNAAYFPTNTTDSNTFGGLDLISGGAMFFDEVLEVGIGDRVWEDWNGDGIQDAGEPGLSNVLVHIYTSDDVLAATSRSDSNGYYFAQGMGPGTYTVQFFPPDGYQFSPQYARTDPDLDSDPDSLSGITDPYVLGSGQTNRSADAGLFLTPGNLRLSKTVAPTNVNIGDAVVYTLVLTNAGTPNTALIQVTDALPSAFVFSGYGSTSGTFTSADGVWNVGTLAPGAAATLSITGTVNVGSGGSRVTNVASVSRMNRPDTNLADNAASASFEVQAADLALSKIADRSAMEEEDPVVFTIAVTNRGPYEAAGIEIDDLLPAGLSFTAANASQGAYDDDTGVWIVGTLTNGGTATLEISATAQIGSGGLFLTNTASIGASSHEDPNLTDNAASAVVLVYGADLAIAKRVEPLAAAEMQTVTYTLVVTNPGPSEATGIQVSEPLTNGLSYVSHDVSHGSYSGISGVWAVGTLGVNAAATLTIQAMVGGGTMDTVITNRARITATDLPDPDAGNDEATAELSVSSLVLTKASDVTLTVHPGGTITYTVVASNSGSLTHANVSLTDLVPAGTTYVPGSLAVTRTPATLATNVYDSSSTFMVPAGVTNLIVEAWGGGGGGGRARGNPATGGGGAGGSYAKKSVAVVPLQSYTVTVGTGGIGGYSTGTDSQHGSPGTPSWFNTTNTVFAQGGARGLSDGNINYRNGSPGAGSSALCVGDVVHRGGNGGGGRYTSGTSYRSGAGGGGAGTTGNGGDALTNGVSGSGTALHGGNGAAGVTNNRTGASGAIYGGGGSGGKANDYTDRNGGSGANGLVLIAYESTGDTNAPPDLASNWTLAPGQKLQATFQVQVEDPLERMAITNTATASSDQQLVPLSATVVDPVIHADLAIEKTASASSVEEGAALSFTLTLTNLSVQEEATGVEVGDLIPAGFVFDDATPSQGAYNPTTGVWLVGSLAPESAAVLQMEVTAAAGSGGFWWTNTAAITAYDQVDPELSNNTASAIVLVAGADLALSKTVNNPTPNETAPVVYTLRLTNSGPSDVAGISVFEPLTNGLIYVSASPSQGSYDNGTGIWSVGAVTSGYSATLTLTAEVGGGTFGTVITNRSRISAASLADPVGGNNQDEATIAISGLQVSKTSDVVDYATPGDIITYAIAISNLSPVTHTGIQITDALPTGTVYVADSTWIDGPGTNSAAGDAAPGLATNRTLEAGEALTVTFQALVINPGSVTQLLNTVSVTCDQQPMPVVASVADGVRHTDLGLSKSVNDVHPDEGETVVYTLVVTNSGPNAVGSLLVSEPLTNGLTYASHSAGQGSYSSASGIWTVGTLAVGASAQLQISATVDAGTAGTSLTNWARISGADMADILPLDNAATAVLTVVSVDVGIGKSANPLVPVENGLVVYAISVTNFGPDPATAVEVTDVLPSSLSYISHEAGQGTYDPNTGIWAVGAMDPLQISTLTLTAVVAADTAGTAITNTASLTGVDQIDADAGNDSAQVVVNPGEALLTITKSAEPAGPVWAGEIIAYAISITNRSGIAQTNVTVTDPLPAGAVYVADSCQVNAPVTVNETFGDQFSRRVYSNNDGTELWTGDWVEGENNGPTAGYIQIQFDNGVDETYTLRFSGGSQSIRRAADLSLYASAALELDYQRIGLEAGEYVAIQASSNGTAWTELGRFSGAATDADYIHFSANLSAFISTSTVIRFISPSGMDSTDIVWIDDVLITGTRRLNQTVPGGEPPALVSGITLETNETMLIQFEVWVDNPAIYTQIVNQASLTSAQTPTPQIATVFTPVDTCFTAAPEGLHADPTNVTSFTARWTEVPGAFGYRLDVSTDMVFSADAAVAGYSNRAVPGTFQSVTGLVHDFTYYFRVRAEWDSFCTSANSPTQMVTTLGLPTIAVFPEELDFGVVDVLASSNLTVTVTNSGSGDLDLSSIVFSGPGNNYFSALPATSSIPSSNSITLTVTFAPTAGGTSEWTMILYNNSPDFPELEVPVRGECFDPAAQTPELLNFWATDSFGLTNEVTDRSLGGGMATAGFTFYHASGMTLEGASFDLIYPDGTLALSNAAFSSIGPVSLGGRDCQEFLTEIPHFFPAVLGVYTARVTAASSNGIWLTEETHFTSVSAGSAVPMTLDTFSRADVADNIGEGWLSNLTGPVGGNVQIRNRVLQLYGPGGTGGTNGRISVVRDLSTRYAPVLTNNAGTMTWAFNFYSGRTNQLGFAPGAYGAAFVLGADSAGWVSGTGNGYAVRIRNGEVALVSFTGGLDLDSDLTPLGASATLSSATASVAVQVDLEAATGVWSLYVRELSGSGIGAFGNPLDDIMESHLVAQVTNIFHLHRSLPYAGCYWNHGNAAVGTNTAAFFDDLYAPYVLLPSEPMRISTVDNDIMLPTSLGYVCVNDAPVPEEVPDRLGVVWTNAPEFIVTFDPLASDQDPGYSIRTIQRDIRGIGEYRVSPDPVNVLSASNRGSLGRPFPVVTTNGALANYGFEIVADGGDWKLDSNCFYQTKADDLTRVFEGTNSLRQTPGGVAYQIFEFRNESGVIPRVDMSGWYRGGPAGVTIAAFSTNDLLNPVATATLSPTQAEEWTSFSLPAQDLGDSTIEFLKVSLTAAGGETFWDYLRLSVDIGTNRSSMRFRAGAENQGLVPQYIFAVDADYNRGGDRLAGLTKYFYIPFDMTPPTPVDMPLGGTGASTDTVDDPTTQFDLQWSTNGIGPDDPDDPVHPTKNPGDIEILSKWHSYKIYCGTYDPQMVPFNDDPTSTNGYIYKSFVANGAYRSWTQVNPDTPIADPSAPSYQSNYLALTNLATPAVRLYDLDYDQDYVVVVVSVDKAGNIGNAGVQSWSTNNTIRFALIRGETIDKSVAKAAFPEARLDNTNTPTAAALHWIASGPTNEQGVYTAVSKDYDLITWDSSRFQESGSNQWRLVDTVRSNWFVDDGGQMKSRGQLRFYRASYKDRWRTTNALGQIQRRVASEEIYSMHNVVLSSGPNFVALHGIPYTNTFNAVFGGVETFPGGASAMPDSGSTVLEFYNPGTNAISTEQYFLSTQGRWMQIGGDDVTDVLQPSNFFSRGFSITLPDPLPEAYVRTNAMDANLDLVLPAMIWSPIMQVPTNQFSQVIYTGQAASYGSGGGRTNLIAPEVRVYNVAALRLPVSAHPSEMQLLESGFVCGPRDASDQLYTMNTSTKTVRQGSTLYCDANHIWRFMTTDEEVPPGFFAPNDMLVIVSKNGGVGNTWTWRYDAQNFYDLPTRWMEP